MIKIIGLTKIYKNREKDILVLDKINLIIKRGEFLTLIGPNGCGKTTLVNILSNIEYPSNGKIEFLKEKVKIGYMFQDYRPTLLPWKKVWENIGLPLRWKENISKIEIRKKVEEMIEDFSIKLDLEAYPFTLSGGQSQLVGILRTFIINPDILILDEPFSALDYFNKINLMIKLQEIWLKYKPTTIFVSHDIDEALFLGDRVVVMSRMPAKIIYDVLVPLPRPRDMIDTTKDKYIKTKQKILKYVKNYIVST